MLQRGHILDDLARGLALLALLASGPAFADDRPPRPPAESGLPVLLIVEPKLGIETNDVGKWISRDADPLVQDLAPTVLAKDNERRVAPFRERSGGPAAAARLDQALRREIGSLLNAPVITASDHMWTGDEALAATGASDGRFILVRAF